jgi:hypothetical protein
MGVKAWMQYLAVGIVCKYQQDYKTVESVLTEKYRAVIQPMQMKQLMIMPEGQRGWAWYTLHAEPGLQLSIDDIVVINQTRYRVMAQQDWSDYGYVEYQVVRGFEQL